MTRSFCNLSSDRKSKITTRRTALSYAVALLCALTMQRASASITVYANYQDKPFFEFEILNIGEDPTPLPPEYGLPGLLSSPQRDLTSNEVIGLEKAGALWAEILGPGAVNSTPVKVQVIGVDEYYAGASGISLPNIDASGQFENVTEPLAQITANKNAQVPAYVTLPQAKACGLPLADSCNYSAF